jgi:ABC-type bacteriocin/lantibiotic exporter with double-glycine peptidase domain
MKVLECPRLIQTYNYDCGAKALQIVLAYYGVYVSEGSLIRSAGTTTKNGTEANGMLRTLRKYGLEYEAGKMTVSRIKCFIDKKIPVILLLQAWAGRKITNWNREWSVGHYVVAVGYDKTKIYFDDPNTFNMAFLTSRELVKRWHSKMKGSKHINYGIAVFGKRPTFDPKKIVHMG